MPRRVDGPRRIKNGIRLRRRDGADNLPWPASSWLRLVAGQATPEVFNEALDYAKAGQAASLVITPGAAEAVIQGRVARPYRVQVEVAQLATNEWERIVATMAAEAIWSAKLLSGELPQSIELLFRSTCKPLVPESPAEVKYSCTCSIFADAPSSPCKHVVAAWLLVAERIEADALLSFTLRGLDGQRLLERLQEARTIATRGVARAHSAPSAAESLAAPPPVERCMQDFWRPGRRLSELDELVKDEHVPHAILRRLGPSPFQANANRAAHIQPAPAKGMPALPPVQSTQPVSKFPLVGLLASIYDSIALASRKLRDGDATDTAGK
ncbi:MAG: hypothetical protein U0572_07545 [Phycisphaerales bacterium]